MIADGGATLLQKAIELNKTKEVAALLVRGVEPLQMSVFGAESTTNIQEAMLAGNDAAKLVLEKFAKVKCKSQMGSDTIKKVKWGQTRLNEKQDKTSVNPHE